MFVVVLVFGVILTACSGGGSPSSPSSTVTSARINEFAIAGPGGQQLGPNSNVETVWGNPLKVRINYTLSGTKGQVVTIAACPIETDGSVGACPHETSEVGEVGGGSTVIELFAERITGSYSRTSYRSVNLYIFPGYWGQGFSSNNYGGSLDMKEVLMSITVETLR
ncbi:MAG TPA: hypothetical protein VGC58_00725 [Candidatus Paceibacterota bacterium]